MTSRSSRSASCGAHFDTSYIQENSVFFSLFNSRCRSMALGTLGKPYKPRFCGLSPSYRRNELGGAWRSQRERCLLFQPKSREIMKIQVFSLIHLTLVEKSQVKFDFITSFYIHNEGTFLFQSKSLDLMKKLVSSLSHVTYVEKFNQSLFSTKVTWLNANTKFFIKSLDFGWEKT
jgi:hypothetical protein